MKIHYYLDWYYEKGFSEKLVQFLQKDTPARKSLVFISGEPSEVKNANDEQTDVLELLEKSWFDKANILFDEYHLIDDFTEKAKAQQLIQEASVLFICGGYTTYQMRLINKLELATLIKNRDGVILGTSAGGMNMSKAYAEEGQVYEGLGLHPFSFEAHFDYENIMLMKERSALSEKMDIYVAADQDGAMRVHENQIDIIGSVYLISNSELKKLAET